MSNDQCNKINGFPIPKAYREAYENQSWFYNTPDCTYCKNPPSDVTYCNTGMRENYQSTEPKKYTPMSKSYPYPQQNTTAAIQRNEADQGLDWVINQTKELTPGKLLPLPKEDLPYIPLKTDVIYFNKSPTGTTYYAYPNAYPAYPYLPCVFPNTSSESYS